MLRIRLLLFLLIVFEIVRSQTFYNNGAIQKIEIQFSQNNWDYILDTAAMGKGNYFMAQSIKINGVQLNNVGVKYKGNSSFDSTNLKNPIHVELDQYTDQDYQGYTDIKLSNCYEDPSMIREVLAYDILRNYMHCPKANFAQVYINGIYMGVYSNIEAINKQFCGNHFYSNDGTFIKCNPIVNPSAATKANLKQLSGDSTNYFNFYEIKSDYGWKQLEALCDSVTNQPNTIANILDVDKAMWMLAFNNLFINLDSYSGAFCQNYYLYKDNTGRYNPIVWDLNMSFGGFPFLGNSNTSLGSLSIANMQNLPANIHSTDNYWPLIKAIYNNASYKKMYIAHLKTMLNEVVATNSYVTNYTNYKTLIDTAVQSDNRKFFTYTQFQNALNTNYSVGSYSVPGIQTLMSARASYLQSTADFTVTSPAINSVSLATSGISLNSTVTCTATVTNAASAYFNYRFSTADKFTRIQMYDDGAHNDGAAGDNVYGINFNMSGNQAEYYVYAENSSAGVFSPERAEYEFYQYKILPVPQPGEVVINEFLAKNKSDVLNEFNLSEDWIELYNNTNSTLSLSNIYLSDSYKQKARYAFPKSTVIQPKSYLIVWADEITLAGNQLHANFKLDEDGDKIMLSDGRTTVLDSIRFGNQSSDESIGRCPDGTGSFTTIWYPTYNAPNCIVGIDEKNLGNFFSIYPNPAKDKFTLTTSTNKDVNVEIYNVMGQKLAAEKFNKELTLETSGWPTGIYFVKCNNFTKKLIISN